MNKITGVAKSIKTNSFHWVNLPNIMSNFAGARLYMALQFIMRDYKYYGSPFYQGAAREYLNLDDYLQDAVNKYGLDILLCCNQSTTDIAIQWDGDPESKPIDRDADPLDPKSYYRIAKFFFNMAARYGSVAIDHSRLEVNDEIRWNAQNVIKSGLNLLKRLELWNEPFAWWRGVDSKLTPEEYACMYSMCLDGNRGQYIDCGVLAADPGFELIMGGMSEMNTEHLDRFLAHLRLIRFDPHYELTNIHFHHYCNSGTDKPDGYTPGQWVEGQSPESNHLEARLKKMVDWRDLNCPHAKLIYGEFGYDSSDKGQSWQKSHGETNQANWLVRTYLLSIKMGINECYMFNCIDGNNSPNGDLWATSGMYSSEVTNYQPKESAFAVIELIKQLNGYLFRKDISRDNIRILSFQKGRTFKYYYWVNEGTKQFKIGNTIMTATEKPQFKVIRGYEPRTNIIRYVRNTANSTPDI